MESGRHVLADRLDVLMTLCAEHNLKDYNSKTATLSTVVTLKSSLSLHGLHLDRFPS